MTRTPKSRPTAAKTTAADETTIAGLRRMLSADDGVTLAGLSAALGWKPHSVRAAMSGLRKSGLAIERTPPSGSGGESTYRIVEGGSLKP